MIFINRITYNQWTFNLLSCELYLKCYIELIFIEIILKQNKNTILSQLLLKNLKLFLLILQ